MEHYQIRYFLAACGTLHFTRAAEQAGVSQPALTKAIQKLEDELGSPLFLRDGRMVVLTEFGRLMREKLTKVVNARQEAEQAAQQFLSPGAVQLNVGIMCSIGPTVLVGLLDRFRLEHPEIELRLHDVTPQSAAAAVQKRELDCAFLALTAELPSFYKSKKLYRERMVAAFSAEHRFNMLRRVTLDDLRGERYIDRMHCEFRDMFMQEVEHRRLDLTFPFASEREDWIQSMIANGLGICMLPEYLIETPGVNTRAIDDPPINRSIELAYLPGHENSHGLMALIDQAAHTAWPVTGEKWTRPGSGGRATERGVK